MPTIPSIPGSVPAAGEGKNAMCTSRFLLPNLTSGKVASLTCTRPPIVAFLTLPAVRNPGTLLRRRSSYRSMPCRPVSTIR